MMQKQVPPLQRNDTLELAIDTLGSEGQGIGRYNGYTVFVPFALPGERVRAHIIKATSSYAVGKLLEVIQKSANRVEPACTCFGRCGGCSLLHLAYPEQLLYKQEAVSSALKRIGGFQSPNVFPTIGMDFPYSYRNKGSFPFANVAGRVAFGFFAPRSHRLIPFSNCPIQRDAPLQVAQTVCDCANELGITAYDETTHSGSLRHVVARVSATGEIMAILVTKGELAQKERFIARLRACIPGLVSIVYNRNDADTNVIFGAHFETIWGKPYIEDVICGLHFRVSAASFLQVNAKQTEKLYHTAVHALQLHGTERIVDLYCGIGTISLLLAQHAAHVDGIEFVPEAINDAEENAKLNEIKNADFHCGAAEEILPRLVQNGLHPDAVVLDPPRKGCEPPVLEALLASGAQKIVYVSCNPATLARDARILADGGFQLVSAQPVDMFPQTAHVETVVLLGRELEKSSEHVYLDYEPSKEIDLPGGATYSEIKQWIQAKYGLKVSSLYVAQVKQKHGIVERECYNKPKSENAKQPKCPPEKEAAIEAALKHFKMI